MQKTWFSSNPCVVVKLVKDFPSYLLAPPPPVPSQMFPDLSIIEHQTALSASPSSLLKLVKLELLPEAIKNGFPKASFRGWPFPSRNTASIFFSGGVSVTFRESV